MNKITVKSSSIELEQLKEIIYQLIEERKHEVEDMPNGSLAYKYYTMALDDIYYISTGENLSHED